jgi:hypothetical protein
MKNLLLLLAIIPTLGFSQNILKNPRTDSVPLTITPLVFDPQEDSTISYIEFWQDTTAGKYDEKIYAVVYEREKKKYDDGGTDWPVLGVGFIGDYRVGNSVQVIIKTHHKDGSVKTFTYKEKIKKLDYWSEDIWTIKEAPIKGLSLFAILRS